MIDEDLYKLATEELNSDARKADVWARACALASDDHDEARFLYTNLRVEEMLNKDGKQRTFSTSTQPRDPSTSGSDSLDDFELSTDSQDIPESRRAGIATEGGPLPSVDAIDLELEASLDPSRTSVSGTNSMSTRIVDFDEETMAELSALTDQNDQPDKPLSGITGEPIVKPTQLNNPDNDDVVSEVLGSSTAATSARIVSPEQQKSTDLTHNLERQVASMNHAEKALDSDAVPMLETEPAHGSTVAAPMDSTLDNAHNFAAEQSQSDATAQTVVRSDYADNADILAEDDTLVQLSELDTGTGRAFMMFSRRGVIKSIKRGVSWPALFFTFPWLLSKAMFGTALVYGCLWLVSLAGLFTTLNNWLQVGGDASLGIKLWTFAFGLLAIIGLLYLPFRYGNRWAAERLQNRGFVYETAVSASSKRDALNRLLQADP